MSSSIKKVVLIGASGSLGSRVLAQLQDNGFTVTVVSRKSSKATFSSGVRVVTVADDLPTAELVAAFEGQDAVINTTSFLSEDADRNIVDAAVEARVKRLIPSEFGSNTEDEQTAELMPYPFGIKNKQLKYIKSKESTGLTWTAIGNGVFFDWAFQVTKAQFLHIDLQKRTAIVQDDGNHRFSVSNTNQVALAVVRALQKSEETKNRFLFIQSFLTTQNEIIAALEKEIGAKFEVKHVKNDEFLNQYVPKARNGDVDAAHTAIMAHLVPHGNHELEERFANDLLGLPSEDLETSLKEALKGIKY